MSNTANYNLKTWATSEITDSFNNFVFGMAGDVNSNMTKIDTQMKSSADGVSTLKNVPIKTVFASMVSDSYYTATVSDYSAYVNGNVFLLMLDVTSHDTLTLNINSFGTLSLMKYKADGNIYNIESGDILANTVVVIRYDGTRWLVVGSPTTNPSKMFYPDSIYGGILSSNLNTITVSGFYTAYGTATGAPNTSSSWYIQHINSNAGTVSAMQVANSFTTSEVYKRLKTSSVWGSWINVTSSDVVRYTDQTLTEGQKTQARTNIDAQKTLSSGNPLPTASGGLGATFVTFAAIATEIANQLGLKSLAYLHFQSGVASITIPAGETRAEMVITYDDAFSAKPIGRGVCLSGTGYPGNNGGKYASLSNIAQTSTQISVAVQVGTAPESDLSVPVSWWACGTHV